MAKSGNTKAYQEYRQKDIARREGSYSKLANELMAIFSELGGLKHVTPDSDEVQKKISALQKFITDNYYVCTKEILSGWVKCIYAMNALRKILTGQAGKVLLNLLVRLFVCIARNISGASLPISVNNPATSR